VANGEGRCTIPVPPERLADSPSDALAGLCQPSPVRIGSGCDSSQCQARNSLWNRFLDHTTRSATASRAYTALPGATQKESSRPSHQRQMSCVPFFIRPNCSCSDPSEHPPVRYSINVQTVCMTGLGSRCCQTACADANSECNRPPIDWKINNASQDVCIYPCSKSACLGVCNSVAVVLGYECAALKDSQIKFLCGAVVAYLLSQCRTLCDECTAP
jgi:hypothetical protein